MKRTLLFMLLMFSFSCVLFGQDALKISGKITDNNGEPLIGANVIIKTFKIGAIADFQGKYTFDVPANLVKGQTVEIAASLISYKTKTVKIVLTGTSLTQNFSLEQDAFRSDEVVVTGIATKTSKSVAEISVGRVAADELQQLNTYGGISQLLAGKVSGVQMTTASGNVGSGWRFFVRGGGGLNGDGQPVIYIDGVRIDNQEVIGYAVGGQGTSTLANLNQNDIEKIDFLKGPAAASMYGANGSNGVVLITTKSGKLVKGGSGGMTIDYKYNYGINQKQYTYSAENFCTADVINRQFKQGIIRENEVSIAGGNNSLKYYTSFDNRYEGGIMNGTSGDRSSVRVNLTSVPYDNLTAKISASYVKNHYKRPNNDNIIYGALGNTILSFVPFNYVAEVDIPKFDDDHDINQFVGSVALTYSPIANLEINGGIGIDNTGWRQVRLFPYGVNWGGLISTTGQKSIYERFNRQFTYDLNASYRYQIIDFLDLRSTAGAQFFDRTVKTTNVLGEQFTSSLISGLGAAGKISGWGETFANLRDGGLFTEHTLSYMEQFFLTLGLRKDFASSIGAEAPSITYPKASFAVRMDKFDFFPRTFDLFKVRMAYGESGVLPGTLDGIPLLYAAETGGYGAGGVINAIGNKEIQPERVKEFEVGIDFELLKSISIEATYYIQNAKNSIVGKANAPSTGLTASTQPFNVGSVDASGFELLLQYSPFKTTDYSLDLSLIWNYQKNEVKNLGGAQPIYSVNNVLKDSMPKFEFHTYTSTAAAYDAAGKYTSSVRSLDRVDLGNPIPSSTGSFTVNFKFLKNFSLYAFAEWALDNKIFNYTQLFANRMGNGGEYNRLTALLGLPEIAKGAAPAVTPLTPGSDEYKATAEKYAKLDWRYNGNYIQDADYLIIREVSIGYDLTDVLSNFELTKYVKGMSVGISARNVWRTTKYSGADVELNYTGSRTIARGNDFLTMQTPRTINFWLRIGL